MKWVSITEFPDYEINLEGVIRRKGSTVPVKVYLGYDYEYVDAVYLWRDGVRECRSVKKLLAVALEVTDLGKEL